MSVLLEGGRQDFTGARAAVVGDRYVEIGDGRGTTDQTQHAFQQSILAENAKFQQCCWYVGQILGRSAASSFHAGGHGAPSTPNQDWNERKRQAIAGLSTDIPTPKLSDDEDELAVQQLALKDQPPHLKQRW